MKNPSDDIMLMQQIKGGDETAFKTLFYRYVDSLERFVSFYIRDREKAQELVLDLFTYIWEKRDSLQIRLTLKAYLFQSAKNKALTYMRDNKKAIYLDDMNMLTISEDGESRLEVDELSALIEEAVVLLPEKCRDIFHKSRGESMSNKEIASALNISEKTVENQITIALRKIKNYLGNKYSYLW